MTLWRKLNAVALETCLRHMFAFSQDVEGGKAAVVSQSNWHLELGHHALSLFVR